MVFAYLSVGEPCSASGARLLNGTTFTDGLVDLCSEGYRAGLCYTEFILNPEAAIVLCRQLGFNTSNPGMSLFSMAISHLLQ